MKRIIAASLLALLLSGCDKNEQEAFDFAKKEITKSISIDENIQFKDIKLVRVVKLSNGTIKGIVCGMSTDPKNFAGYKDFAVFYNTEFGSLSGNLNYVLVDKILPGQDDKSVIAICHK